MESQFTQLDMSYNSRRTKLLLPEYGRHVQNLLKHAKNIEDKEKRQVFVEVVVGMMQQIQTQARPSFELTEKLWNHVFMIAGYDLEVDVPENVTIVKHTESEAPPRMEYPLKDIKYRHYGFNVQQMIDKAKDMDDEEKKALFSNAIGSYMKLAYKTWNSTHYVSDDIIKEDLRMISMGEVTVPAETSLDFLTYTMPLRPQRKKRSNNQGKGRRDNNNKNSRQRRRR